MKASDARKATAYADELMRVKRMQSQLRAGYPAKVAINGGASPEVILSSEVMRAMLATAIEFLTAELTKLGITDLETV